MSKIDTQVKVCTIEDIGLTLTGEGADPLIDTLNEYLSIFAAPTGRKGERNTILGSCDCLKCGRQLDGAFGTFSFGMASGEGICTNCGWPCRAHHNPMDDEGPIFTEIIEMVLQYHPDVVKEKP